MKALTAEESALRKRAWDLEHRLEAVGSKDAKIIRDLLDKIAEYHKMLPEGAKNTEQPVQPDSESDDAIPIPITSNMVFRFGNADASQVKS